MKKREVINQEYRSTAWCECGYSLTCIELLDDSNIIKGHEYYCIGCDETYKLQKVSEDENS